jgi:hypothetical protein
MLILFLIRLDNRVKIGLVSNLRPSSARDFRLKIEEVRREETVEAEVSHLSIITIHLAYFPSL